LKWRRDKLDKAEQVKVLRGGGVSRRKISQATGISMSHIDRLIRLFGIEKGARLIMDVDLSSGNA
jgi:transposase